MTDTATKTDAFRTTDRTATLTEEHFDYWTAKTVTKTSTRVIPTSYSETLADYVDLANKVGSPNKQSHTHGKDFAGTYTFDEAVVLAKTGWQEPHEGVKRVVEVLREKFADRIAERYEGVLAVEGGSVDVSTFLMGEPECMITYEPTEDTMPGKVVRITMSSFASCETSQDAIRARGAATCALIEVLTLLGYSVEVMYELVLAYNPDQPVRSHFVTLKRSTDSLDIDNLMFALCHPAMFRRLGFAVQEGMPGWDPGYHYGYRAHSTDSEADITIGGIALGDDLSTDKATIAWVTKHIVAVTGH